MFLLLLTMPYRYYCLLCFWGCCIGGLSACQPTASRYVRSTQDLATYVTQLPLGTKPATDSKTSPCDNWANYAPDSLHPEHTPVRWIRINIHIMNSTDSSHNFKGDEAIHFVEATIARANQKLNENKQMWLPHGNHTPALPPRFQWRLTGMPDDKNDRGIYFHYDDELFWVNKKGPGSFHSRNICNKYSVQSDSVINIFWVEHHPDSIKSPTYRATDDGIGYTNCVKIINAYNAYLIHQANPKIDNAFEYRITGVANLLNHELGHSLGLSHTWGGNDGCDDTPQHSNCWNFNEGKNCESEVSNNVMDYNAYRDALTPCQLAKIHSYFWQPKQKQAALIAPVWCAYDPQATIYIHTGDTISWLCHKDFNGDIVVRAGAQLTLNCQVSMPPTSKISVESGGTLILDGCRLLQRCAHLRPWRGIELQYQRGKTRPRLIVKNGATLEGTQALSAEN